MRHHSQYCLGTTRAEFIVRESHVGEIVGPKRVPIRFQRKRACASGVLAMINIPYQGIQKQHERETKVLLLVI